MSDEYLSWRDLDEADGERRDWPERYHDLMARRQPMAWYRRLWRWLF